MNVTRTTIHTFIHTYYRNVSFFDQASEWFSFLINHGFISCSVVAMIVMWWSRFSGRELFVLIVDRGHVATVSPVQRTDMYIPLNPNVTAGVATVNIGVGGAGTANLS